MSTFFKPTTYQHEIVWKFASIIWSTDVGKTFVVPDRDERAEAILSVNFDESLDPRAGCLRWTR